MWRNRFMKVLIFTFFVIVLSNKAIYSSKNQKAIDNKVQETSYVVTMKKLILQSNNPKIKGKEYEQLEKEFEKIAIANSNQWLPYYYCAFCWANFAAASEVSNIDKYCDKANGFITKAERLSKKNSEILCIKALILSVRIKVNVMERGLKNLAGSDDLLNQALKID